MKLKHLISLLVVCCLAAQAVAAPLDHELPGSAIAYAGWAGRGLTFDGSMLGQLLQEPLVARSARAVVEMIAKQISPNHAERVALAAELANIVWQQPIGLAIYDFLPAAEGRLPAAVILVDLGPQRDEFAAKVDELLALIADRAVVSEATTGTTTYRLVQLGDIKLSLGYMDQVFFVCTDEDLPARLAQLPAAQSLAGDERFAACYKEVTGENEQFVVYLDAQAMMEQIEKLTVANGSASQPMMADRSRVRQIADALGLGKLTAIASSTQIRQRGLYNKTRLFTPGPHKGLLTCLAGGTLTDADLAGVPADAIFVSAIKLSASAALDEAHAIAEGISPGAQAILELALEGLNEQLGISIAEDLLGSLGDTWVLASAPSYGGFLAGTVLSVEVTDPEKLVASLDKIEQLLTSPASQPADVGAPEPDALRIATCKAGRAEIRYLLGIKDMPVIAPAWCVHNGRLYLAGWPQVLESALSSDGRDELTASDEFTRVRSMVSSSATALVYADSRAIVRSVYPLHLLVGTTMRSLSGQLGIPNADINWPMALWKLEKYTSTEITVAYADAAGITLESYGSSPLDSSTAGGLLAVSILAPAIGQAQRQAKTIASVDNLHGLGKCIAMYTISNNNQPPDDLAALVEQGYTPSLKMFVSHLSGRAAPRYVDGRIVGEIDYIYIKLPSGAPGELVNIYERPENYTGRGTNVLFNDGTVQWLDMELFRDELERTRQWLDQNTTAGNEGL